MRPRVPSPHALFGRVPSPRVLFPLARLSLPRVLLALLLAWAAPALAPAQGIDGQDAGERPAAAELRADRERDVLIAERVRNALRGVSLLSRVRVEASGGVVTLTGRAPDAEAIARAAAIAEAVEGVAAVNNEVEEVTDLDERLDIFLERTERRLWQALAFLPLLLVALAVLAAIVLFGRWLSRRRWPFRRVAPNAFIGGLLRQVVMIAFAVAGLVVALDILGATALLSTVLGAAGLVGLAVGFAVRDTVENYVASILLSLRQPFRPKDFVSIGEHQGSVAKLTSRATVLVTPDGNHLRIPNAVVYKAVIENFTLNPTRRFLFTLGVDADSDAGRARDVGRETLEALPFTLDDPAPQAWIDGVGDSSIGIAFAAWIDQRETDFLRARGEGMRLVKLALEDDGFLLPEPIYRLRFDGALPGAAAGAAPPGVPEASRHDADEESRAAGDVRPDDAVERRVEDVRAGTRSEDGTGADLLDEAAPREV